MSGTEAAPGVSIGLPAEGRGSLASWGKRIGALIIDWGASMVLASAIFGPVVTVSYTHLTLPTIYSV